MKIFEAFAKRINPGDKNHTVAKIKKVTSGSTKAAAEFIDNIYNSVIDAAPFVQAL